MNRIFNNLLDLRFINHFKHNNYVIDNMPGLIELFINIEKKTRAIYLLFNRYFPEDKILRKKMNKNEKVIHQSLCKLLNNPMNLPFKTFKRIYKFKKNDRNHLNKIIEKIKTQKLSRNEAFEIAIEVENLKSKSCFFDYLHQLCAMNQKKILNDLDYLHTFHEAELKTYIKLNHIDVINPILHLHHEHSNLISSLLNIFPFHKK